jgi:putative transposase
VSVVTDIALTFYRRKDMSGKRGEIESESGFDFKPFEKQLQEHIKGKGGTFNVGGEGFVKELVARTYQALLDAELSEHLSEPEQSDNSRNGRGSKLIKGDFGQVRIEPPRDRDSTFEPQIVGKRSSTVGNFTDKIISMYARGMTTREISEHLQEMYGIELSESFVSRAVATIQQEVSDWQQRPLEKIYAIVYVDGIRFNVRGDNNKILKKCFYTVLGVTLEGRQEVLGMWIADTEGASFWLSVLTDLKNRGVKDILIACVDGLTGMPKAIESTFPEADIQLCIIHHIRNCTKFVSYKDRKELCNDMKPIYQAPDEKAAKQALQYLEEKCWHEKWPLLVNFLKYPEELRKITYTTNAIEALHGMFRKNTNNRRVFPNDDALMRLLFLNIKNISKKWTKRQGWNMIRNQLSIIFGDRVNNFLNQKMEN